MPVTYSFEDAVLVLRCLGEYTPAELQTAWDEAVQDPAFTENAEACLDVRESASLASRSTRDLRRITAWFAKQAKLVNNRCALLTEPGVQFGLMRMASVWAEFRGTKVRVFTDRDEALAWLASLGAAQ